MRAFGLFSWRTGERRNNVLFTVAQKERFFFFQIIVTFLFSI